LFFIFPVQNGESLNVFHIKQTNKYINTDLNILFSARKVHKSEMIQSENGVPDSGISILLGAMLWSTVVLLLNA
jgi:hypothetical protein